MFDVWKNVLAEIEQSISREAFATWFTGSELVSIEDNVVTIGAPSIFKISQIKQKYDKAVRDALIHNGVNFEKINYITCSSSHIVKKPREVTFGETQQQTRRESTPQKIDFQSVSNRTQKTFTTGLNSSYSIDTFVVGGNNDLAVSVARSIIEAPGTKFNPFFLYGGPGLGKTHLVQAIGNELLKRDPKLKVLYIPTNHFYSEFIDSIKKNTSDAFSQKFRSLDVLIIDDFQMIMGKDASQVEFFNIFNDLYQLNKQIIVTSDRLPSQIKTLDERLASRLAWAGPIDLQMPSFEDRCAILKSKAEFQGIDVEDRAIEYIAENIKTNIRELEGEFNRILAISELRGVSPLDLISDGYTSTVRDSKHSTVTPKSVVEKVAKHYQLTVDEMCGKSRVTHIKNARQVAMYLLSEELKMSTPKIALEVGVKDHTTVMHGVKKIRTDLNLDFGLREQIMTLREQIYQ